MFSCGIVLARFSAKLIWKVDTRAHPVLNITALLTTSLANKNFVKPFTLELYFIRYLCPSQRPLWKTAYSTPIEEDGALMKTP